MFKYEPPDRGPPVQPNMFSFKTQLYGNTVNCLQLESLVPCEPTINTRPSVHTAPAPKYASYTLTEVAVSNNFLSRKGKQTHLSTKNNLASNFNVNISHS